MVTSGYASGLEKTLLLPTGSEEGGEDISYVLNLNVPRWPECNRIWANRKQIAIVIIF